MILGNLSWGWGGGGGSIVFNCDDIACTVMFT